MKRAFLLVPLLVLPATVLAKPMPKDDKLGPPSKAVTNDILDAVAEEMNRAMTDLVIPGAPKPYHIAYKVTEVEVNEVSASLGQATTRKNQHFVTIEARVRVGSPDFDNGNFAVPGAVEIDGSAATNIALEATPRSAKHAAWLVTDQAYKEALIQLRAKLEARRAGGQHLQDVPAWTAEKPIVSEQPVLVQPLESLDELEGRAKALSAGFNDESAVRDSRVSASSYLERRWYLTTEGTQVTDTRRASGILIAASGQAENGELLHNYFLRYGHTAHDLPSDDELKAEVKKVGDSIDALRKAPRMTRYRGPVLFEGEGAVGLVRATLSPNLGGTPVAEGLNPQEAKVLGGAFTEDVGMPVTAPMLSITDDPTAQQAYGKALIGGYKIDDEGVLAQKVEVVKDGILKTLLTTRTPSQKGQASNGHARRDVPDDGGTFHGSATNLMITGKNAVSRKALEQKLVQAALERKLKFGIVIRRFDDAAVTGAPEFTQRELVAMIKSTDQLAPAPALLVYRIYPDGKEELVRGAQLSEVPVTAWEDVLGVSNEMTVYNFLAATQSQLELKLRGGTEDGTVPSGGIESSIATPDILVKRLDVNGIPAGEHSLPTVPQPPHK